MAKLAFDIHRLYAQAFGDGVGLPFPVIDAQDNYRESDGFDNLEVVTGNHVDPPLKGEFNFKSPHGATYHLPVKMGLFDKPESYWQLPNEPIMSVKGAKMLKVTSIRRGKGRGTIKEERGLKDYEVTIRGLCINETDNEYPEGQIRKLREFCEYNGTVFIKSYLTTFFGIKCVTIKDFDFPRFPENSMRIQPYVLRCISDLDYDAYKRILEGGQA